MVDVVVVVVVVTRRLPMVAITTNVPHYDMFGHISPMLFRKQV